MHNLNLLNRQDAHMSRASLDISVLDPIKAPAVVVPSSYCRALLDVRLFVTLTYFYMHICAYLE